jgi:hypothetical protein
LETSRLPPPTTVVVLATDPAETSVWALASRSTVKLSEPAAAPWVAVADTTSAAEEVAVNARQPPLVASAPAASPMAVNLPATERYSEAMPDSVVRLVSSATFGWLSSCISWLMRVVVSMPEMSPSTLELIGPAP